jgi:predicted kinase
MDLEHLDRAQEAKHLVEVYRRAGGRPGSPELFALFCAYRACVRALVSSLRAQQLDGPRRARAWEECEAYLRLAWTYVWRRHRPIVLAMCGPAAAGKTRLAVELAELTGLPRLSSDRIRKRLGGLEPEQRGDRSLYAQTMSDSVYRRLGLDAAEFPEGAIVDATFRRRADRTTFARALEPFEPIFINCVLSRALTARRARTREREPDHESDAGVSEALAQWDAFEPLTEIPPNGRIDVSTAPRVELVAMQLESKLAQTLNARSLEDDCDSSPAPIRGNYRRPARHLAGSSMS